MRVGLVVPYRDGETLDAALHLADFARSLGVEVRIGSPHGVRRPLSTRWDRAVRALKTRAQASLWARGLDHVVWFGVHTALRFFVAEASKAASHTLVPSWYDLDSGRLAECRCFRKIVVPCREAAPVFMFGRRASKPKKAGFLVPDVYVVPWEPAAFCPPPSGRRDGASLYVHLDGPAVDAFGRTVVPVLDEVLRRAPALAVVLRRDKSWHPRCERALGAVVAAHSPRFRVARPRENASGHTLALIPSPRVYFGCRHAEAWACGVPVVSFHVPGGPRPAHLAGGVRLLCRYRRNAFGASTAVYDLRNAVDPVLSLLSDPPDVRTAVRPGNDPGLFYKFWASQWGLDG